MFLDTLLLIDTKAKKGGLIAKPKRPAKPSRTPMGVPVPVRYEQGQKGSGEEQPGSEADWPTTISDQKGPVQYCTEQGARRGAGLKPDDLAKQKEAAKKASCQN